ncbi:hypothetical protein [Marinomonas spartinae]|nr:hypothetical protein [Marinomonas spartinae]
MNIRSIVETQLTQSSYEGSPVSGSANFALFMSLFNQPGPSIIDTNDTLNRHEPHAVIRPIQFSHSIMENPEANIAMLKSLSEEPLAQGPAYQYNAVEALENQLSVHI